MCMSNPYRWYHDSTHMKPSAKKPQDTANERPQGLERLGDVLRAVIEKNTGRKLNVQKIRVFEIWDRAVGTQISRVARPQSYQNGRLFVGTIHPSWVTELTFRREEIRNKLNHAIGHELVREIIFRLARS